MEKVERNLKKKDFLGLPFLMSNTFSILSREYGMLFNLFGHLTRPGASRENHFRRTHFYPFEFRKEGKIIPVGWTWI